MGQVPRISVPLRFLLFVVVLAVSPVQAGETKTSESVGDADAMVAGVREVALPGVPGTLSVFGPAAFPVVEATSRGRPAPLVAATRAGKGRAVLFGHGYFGAKALAVGDTAQLVENVLRWAAGDAKKTPRVGVRGRNALARRLEGRGFVFVPLDGPEWSTRLGDVDVIVLPLADVPDAEQEILAKRLTSGLGIVAGMPGWGWQQLHPSQRLASDNPANRLLAPFGLVWGSGTVEKPASGTLKVHGKATRLTHAGWALDALEERTQGAAPHSGSEAAVAAATVTRALGDVPANDALLRPRLAALLESAGADRSVPSKAKPIQEAQGLARVLLAWELARDAALPAEAIEAHPAAAVFPGAVPPSAKRVRRNLRIDAGVPRWHGTGLYAGPGDVVTVTVPKRARRAGLVLQIGAHTDSLLRKKAWHRAPEITRRSPIRARETSMASAFGGLIYVVVPKGSALGPIDVTVTGAVDAPRFVLGETKPLAWRRKIRDFPAPWAELETTKVILTVPSEQVRKLDDPEALMRWWDKVMDGSADLAAIEHERPSPERYVTDVQISAGYMHAGYPIMTHLDAAPRFVDLDRLSTKGDWGMFHEMGHNHQQSDWTFQGTVEVTCNLFSLYLMETLCEKGVGHVAMSPDSIAKHRKAFLQGGARFEDWKQKPFTALIAYQELRHAFGWAPFKKVFAVYRDLPAAERPRSDAEKRDQWLIRMSRAVGKDLGPFFTSWSIPTSPEARKAVADLPPWMP